MSTSSRQLLKVFGVSVSLATLLLMDVWESVEQVRAPQSLYLSVSTPLPTLELSALIDTALFAALLLLLIRGLWSCAGAIGWVNRGASWLLPSEAARSGIPGSS